MKLCTCYKQECIIYSCYMYLLSYTTKYCQVALRTDDVSQGFIIGQVYTVCSYKQCTVYVEHLAVTLIWRFGNVDENRQIKITANLTCNQLYI